MKNIAVLLSTYNGEKYLQEQLDSIISQKDVALKIFIRDDGSTDDTVGVINKYVAVHPEICFVNQEDTKNIGVKGSFLELLRIALDAELEFSYFSFADQDDYWLPEKLSVAVKALEASDAGRESLYFSNKTFVDERLNLISNENIAFYDDFYSLFHNTGASGCTMVFNRRLAQLVVRKVPEYTKLHDQWVYRIARCIDASFIFGAQSYIYYRQHGNNVCGMDTCRSNKHNWSGLFKKKQHLLQKALMELNETYNDVISVSNQKFLGCLSDYHCNIESKFFLATNPLAFRRGIKSYVFWLITLFRNTI